MPYKKYNNRYIITLISFSFMLWIQQSQTAEKEAIVPSIEGPSEVKTMSEEEQKALLKRLQANLTEEQRRALTGGKVFAIIGKKEAEEPQVVKEISLFDPIEKKLTGIEKELNSSFFVSASGLKKIGSELDGSVQKELNELPPDQEETASLRGRAIALAEQLQLFQFLMTIEDLVHADINEKRINNDAVNDVERKLKAIKSKAHFQSSASFNKRIENLEQLIQQQKDLLAMAPEQRAQEEVAKMERYLTFLENALKKDEIKAEVIRSIRISLDEMADPKKLNFSQPQQNMLTKRINNLKSLLGILDHLLDMQFTVQRGELSAVMAETIAEGLRTDQKKIEELGQEGLPRELSIFSRKHIAKVNNMLIPKLSEFLDQLGREVDVIAALDQLKDAENRLDILKKLRNNLDLTENQDRDVAEKFVEIETLLNEQRKSLLEQQKINEELQRIQEEREQARQLELQKEKDLQQQEQERQERELKQKMIEQERLKIEQQKEHEIEARKHREDRIKQLQDEIKHIIPELTKAMDSWMSLQDQESKLRNTYMALSRRTTKEEQDKLKQMVIELEEKKEFIEPFSNKIKLIHAHILELYQQKAFAKEDLVPLLTEWIKQLQSIEDKLWQGWNILSTKNSEKQREGKATSIEFIKRNQYVRDQIDTLIGYVKNIRVVDDNKLVLIERAIQERSRPKKAPKPKRQGAFSRYF